MVQRHPLFGKVNIHGGAYGRPSDRGMETTGSCLALARTVRRLYWNRGRLPFFLTKSSSRKIKSVLQTKVVQKQKQKQNRGLRPLHGEESLTFNFASASSNEYNNISPMWLMRQEWSATVVALFKKVLKYEIIHPQLQHRRLVTTLLPKQTLCPNAAPNQIGTRRRICHDCQSRMPICPSEPDTYAEVKLIVTI